MNRVIKFKYIYSDGKSFIVKIFTLDDITNGDPFEVLSDSPLLKSYRCIARLQWTGLTDKNGVDIYEGDLLAHDEDYSYYLCEWNDKRACFEVNGYGRDVYTGENSQEVEANNITLIDEHVLVFGEDKEHFEVIGDIYQNPELIQKDNV